MQTGNSLQARFEYAQIFDIRVPGPIDSRMSISSIANLDTELPSGVRYTGLFVWVEDIQQFYHFKTGITSGDFVPFTLDITGNYKFVFVLPEIAPDEVFTHNLGTQDFLIQFFLDNQPISIDYEFLEFDGLAPTDHLNKIRFKLNSGQTVPNGTKIVIVS